MNPFALRGPEFLEFYLVLAAASLICLIAFRRWMGPQPQGRELLADPYAIAYLRAGPPEAIRLATVSLIERKLLAHTGRYVATIDGGATDSPHHDLERRVLKTASPTADGERLLKATAASAPMMLIGAELERRGLYHDAAAVRRQTIVGAVVLASLIIVGLAKVAVALDQGHHNVEGLMVATMVCASAAMTLLLNPKRATPRGRALLADLRLLLAPARRRSGGARDEREFLMLGAVFGLKQLHAVTAHRWKELFPAPTRPMGSTCGSTTCGSWFGTSSSSCGTSPSCGTPSATSSSGCGSGGGCGGGGCGGCGGG